MMFAVLIFSYLKTSKILKATGEEADDRRLALLEKYKADLKMRSKAPFFITRSFEIPFIFGLDRCNLIKQCKQAEHALDIKRNHQLEQKYKPYSVMKGRRQPFAAYYFDEHNCHSHNGCVQADIQYPFENALKHYHPLL